MGVAYSPNIFKAKTSDLLATLVDYILYITKGSLDDHLAKLRRVLIRLKDPGLKVNTGKSFFVPLRQNTKDISRPEMV